MLHILASLLAILVVVEWFLNVVLVCIFLMTNGVEYLFLKMAYFENMEEEWLLNLGFLLKSDLCLCLYGVSGKKKSKEK